MNNFEHIHRPYRLIVSWMLAPVLAVTPLNAICFLGYSIGKQLQQSSQAPSLPCSHLVDDSAVSDSTIITSHAMLPCDFTATLSIGVPTMNTLSSTAA